MVGVAQRDHRLPVDRLVGHDPQHQPTVALQVRAEHPRHAGSSQQRLAAARRHLQTDVRDRQVQCAVAVPVTSPAAGIRLSGKGLRQRAALLQRRPGALGEIGSTARLFLHAFHRPQRGRCRARLRLVLLQFIDVFRQLGQHIGLEALELDAARHNGDLGSRPMRQPECLAITRNAVAQFVWQRTLAPYAIDRVDDGQLLQRIGEGQVLTRRPVRRVGLEVDVRAGPVVATGARAEDVKRSQARCGVAKAAYASSAVRFDAEVPVDDRLTRYRLAHRALLSQPVIHRRARARSAARRRTPPHRRLARRLQLRSPASRCRCAKSGCGTCAGRPMPSRQ